MKWVWILVALAAPVVIWVNLHEVGISMPIFIVLVIVLFFAWLPRTLRRSSLRGAAAARVKAGIVSEPDEELSGMSYLALHRQEAKLVVAPPACAIDLADIRGLDSGADGLVIETADAQYPQVSVPMDFESAFHWGAIIAAAATEMGNPLSWVDLDAR